MTIQVPEEEYNPLPGELSLVGYQLPEGLDFEEWSRIGWTLQKMAKSIMFWVGDWIRYGEHRWGEIYAQAIEDHGLAKQTLMNAVWVCEHIEISRRREILSFAHHAEVAALEPADRDHSSTEPRPRNGPSVNCAPGSMRSAGVTIPKLPLFTAPSSRCAARTGRARRPPDDPASSWRRSHSAVNSLRTTRRSPSARS